jgi:fission process protein 1
MVLRGLPAIMNYSRPLAYASELGESMRPVINKNFVRFLYGVSWGYVILDTGIKTYSVKQHGNEAMIYSCLDTSIFHTFASMALPAFTIHSIVKYSLKFLKKTIGEKSRLTKFLPVALGLTSIPFIIHPLDHGTEWVMDKTIRSFYYIKVPYLKEEHEHHHTKTNE